jgi:hypothetical protein
VYRR